MKRAFFALLILILAWNLFSARLLNQPLSVTQPDGSVLNVFTSGDEFHNWLHNADNYTIIKHPDTGYYVWAIQNGDRVVASNFRVDNTNPSSLNITPGINLTSDQIRGKHRQFWGSINETRDSRAPHFGEINNLVIYIKFSDSPEFNHPNSYYDDMFNNATENYNSMHNYFLATSYNQLDIQTHFYPIPNNGNIVCYTDTLPRGYYEPQSTSNPIGYPEDNGDERAAREFQLLVSASTFVESQVPATLDLDGDDDGYIDNICFIVQGSPNGWASLLWPHRWALYGAEAYIHSSRVWDFNLQLESFLDGSGNSVLCHEMSHTLGCPDLYRYYDSTIDPIGNWDLMCGNTNPPQSMSAWMKSKYLDWVGTVPTQSQSGTYTINSVWEPNNNIIRLPSWRTGEYYVVEYRKPFGIYDTEIPGQGLLIYRLNVNYDGNADGPPDELYLYRPNGTSNTVNGVVNMAFFSAQSGRTEINETTVPNGFLSNDLPGGLDISEISASGGETMSFKVVISNLQVTYPKGRETLFGGTPMNITWKARSQNGNVRIDFSPDNGATWQVVTTTTPNIGTYTWNAMPVIDSDQCLIKISMLTSQTNDSNNYPFTILSSIDVPTPVFPLDAMQNAPTNPTLSWNEVPGAASYHVQLANNEGFDPNIINMIDHPDTTLTYNNLLPFTTYYWHVAAYSAIGLSEFCSTQMFTTGNISIIPAVPALWFPGNNAANQPLNATIRWNAAQYADHYHYQVARDSYFANVVQQNDNHLGTDVVLTPLEPNTRYYWRVRSGNPAGFSNFSNSRSFTTGTTTALEDDQLSLVNRLSQNQPNPFNPETVISFDLKDLSKPAKLTIYNPKGQVVKVLFEGTAKSHTNRITWDGKDTQGIAVASGIYYYILESSGYRESRKMLLMK